VTDDGQASRFRTARWPGGGPVIDAVAFTRAPVAASFITTPRKLTCWDEGRAALPGRVPCRRVLATVSGRSRDRGGHLRPVPGAADHHRSHGENVPFYLERADRKLGPTCAHLERSVADYFLTQFWITTAGFISVDYPFDDMQHSRQLLDTASLAPAVGRRSPTATPSASSARSSWVVERDEHG
jgi:hypothetical protein